MIIEIAEHDIGKIGGGDCFCWRGSSLLASAADIYSYHSCRLWCCYETGIGVDRWQFADTCPPASPKSNEFMCKEEREEVDPFRIILFSHDSTVRKW